MSIDNDASAIPIKPLSKTDLPIWLEQNSQHAVWVSANAFMGEPGAATKQLSSC